jgi:hypothetical protein
MLHKERCLIRARTFGIFLRHENILRCERKNARRKYLNNDFFFAIERKQIFIPSATEISDHHLVARRKRKTLLPMMEFSINRNAQQ